jgi:ketosteroid isomerase-like protein
MIRLISICCLTLLIACGSTRDEPAAAATQDTAADEAAIRAGDSAWFTHYNAGHVDSVAALYADDAVLNIPGVPPARGSSAVREALAKDIANSSGGGFTLTQGPTPEIGVSGDLAYVWNTFKVTDKSGATVDVGKYVTVVARKTGEWRIIRDIWNSDNPPAPPAKPASTN